jgi:hypothetical protein
MERGTTHASYALSALFGRHGCLLENSARFCFVFEFCFLKINAGQERGRGSFETSCCGLPGVTRR